MGEVVEDEGRVCGDGRVSYVGWTGRRKEREGRAEGEGFVTRKKVRGVGPWKRIRDVLYSETGRFKDREVEE